VQFRQDFKQETGSDTVNARELYFDRQWHGKSHKVQAVAGRQQDSTGDKRNEYDKEN
jgi:hypothetical protein